MLASRLVPGPFDSKAIGLRMRPTFRKLAASVTYLQQGRLTVCHTSPERRTDDLSEAIEPDSSMERSTSHRSRSDKRSARSSGVSAIGLTTLFACAVVIISVTGCASMQGQTKSTKQTPSEVDQLKSRVQELERENGRLTTRIEQLEDDIFLLQDRVEAHRLALKRQRQQRRRQPRARRSQQSTQSGNHRGSDAQRPQQPPNTHYQPRRRQSQRNVTRIQLNRNQSGVSAQPRSSRSRSESRRQRGGSHSPSRGNQSPDSADTSGRSSTSSTPRTATSDSSQGNAEETDETIVITNEDFEQYASAASGDQDNASDDAAASADTSSSDGRAQPDVTDERLDTTGGESADKRASSEASTSSSPDSSGSPSSGNANAGGGVAADAKLAGKEGLDLYKASLSLYRQGDYARARAGFKQYMKGNPRRDYQDNGLYWIGECEFGLGRYEKAISLFTRVIENHPGGNKVPDAMLKMALAYREMGDEQRATQLLKKVASQYPRTNVGDLAERKMK